MAETQSFVTVSGVEVPTSTIPWNGTNGAAQAITLRDPQSGKGAGVTSSNALQVDGSAVTQPVSGTVGISGTVTVGGSVGVSSLPALPAGSNAIGSVSVSNFPATQPVSGTVSSNATLINGTGRNGNGTGQFIPMADSSAKIDVGAAATQTLVSGVAGKSIYVCSFFGISNGTSGTIQFAYGATPTALTGQMAVTAETGISAGSGIGIIMVVPAGQDLKIVTTGTSTFQGHLSYFQV